MNAQVRFWCAGAANIALDYVYLSTVGKLDAGAGGWVFDRQDVVQP